MLDTAKYVQRRNFSKQKKKNLFVECNIKVSNKTLQILLGTFLQTLYLLYTVSTMYRKVDVAKNSRLACTIGLLMSTETYMHMPLNFKICAYCEPLTLHTCYTHHDTKHNQECQHLSSVSQLQNYFKVNAYINKYHRFTS